MLLFIILTWIVGIPLAVLMIATAFAWWCDRRERQLTTETAGSARIYHYIPRSRPTA